MSRANNLAHAVRSIRAAEQRAHGIPSLVKEGWPRHQENRPVPLKGADGVVRSSSNNNRWLERTTPSTPLRWLREIYLLGAATPPLPRRGVYTYFSD